jgi:[acyl-carrier-protein] S-malonyltransferase
MKPAADVMREALAKVAVQRPKVPLVANVTAAPVTDPAEIVQLLVRQVTGLVRWRESVEYLVAHGVDRLVEVGAGRVLTGLIKRIAKDSQALPLGRLEDLVAFKPGQG